MTRQEPWMAFGPDQDTPGLPSVLLAQAVRAERAEAAKEQREREAKRAELEDRHEARLHRWMATRMQQLSMERRAFDPGDPSTLVMGMDEMATRVFDAEDAAIARAETRQAIADGRLHVLNVPASEMSAPPPSPEELEAERADLQLQRARHKTEHQGLVSRMRRGMKKAVKS